MTPETDELRTMVLEIADRTPRFPDHLTPAEQEVAALVFEGLTNAEIAEQRGTSVKTVGKQISSLLRKTGTASRVELVLLLLGQAPS